MTVALISHPDCLRHTMGAWHPESPDRLQAVEDQLIASGLMDHVARYEAPLAHRDELERVHGTAYVDAIERSAPLPCSFELPAPPPGMDYLRDRVEVLFTPSAAPRQTVPQVGSADRCGAGGFYFSSSTRIELCPSTCELVSADRDGRIDIALGCAVVPI